MRHLAALALALTLAACTKVPMKTRPPAPVKGAKLRTVAELGTFPDAEAKSRAAFAEASKVLLHPRCVNCHPPDDRPRQGEASAPHDPPVDRGFGGFGPFGMACPTCHQLTNLELSRVPGAPNWHLAPLEMAWLGRTPAQVCAQLKDPLRNGGKTLEQLVEHSAKDELVGWGWSPGADREPAPGTQALFGELMAAWAENGAVCEEEER